MQDAEGSQWSGVVDPDQWQNWNDEEGTGNVDGDWDEEEDAAWRDTYSSAYGDADGENGPAGVSVNEDEPARYKFHQQLHAAAREGNVEDVLTIFDDMTIKSKLVLGPYAHHAYIFANVKANDMDSALEAAKDAIQSGIALLEETYVVLVYGFVEADDLERAEKVMASMYNAGLDPQKGWLTLVKGLFRKGFRDLGFEHLERGLQEGWTCDASLFEYVIKGYCDTGSVEHAAQLPEQMLMLNVTPRTRHYNAIVQALSARKGFEHALEYIQKHIINSSSNVTPTETTFNAVLRGYLEGSEQMSEYAYNEGSGASTPSIGAAGLISAVRDAMKEADAPMGPTHFELSMKCCLKERSVDEVLNALDQLRRLTSQRSPQSDWCRRFQPAELIELLTMFSMARRPLALVELLREMRSQRASLASAPHLPEGRHSFLTDWLVERLPVLERSSITPDGITSELMASSSVKEFDGTIREVAIENDKKATSCFIGVANCVVDENGKPLPMAQMRKSLLVAELEARGEDTEGKAAELRTRVKLQRKMLTNQINDWLSRSAQRGARDGMARLKEMFDRGLTEDEARQQLREDFGDAGEQLQVTGTNVAPTQTLSGGESASDSEAVPASRTASRRTAQRAMDKLVSELADPTAFKLRLEAFEEAEAADQPYLSTLVRRGGYDDFEQTTNELVPYVLLTDAEKKAFRRLDSHIKGAVSGASMTGQAVQDDFAMNYDDQRSLLGGASDDPLNRLGAGDSAQAGAAEDPEDDDEDGLPGGDDIDDVLVGASDDDVARGRFGDSIDALDDDDEEDSDAEVMSDDEEDLQLVEQQDATAFDLSSSTDANASWMVGLEILRAAVALAFPIPATDFHNVLLAAQYERSVEGLQALHDLVMDVAEMPMDNGSSGHEVVIRKEYTERVIDALQRIDATPADIELVIRRDAVFSDELTAEEYARDSDNGAEEEEDDAVATGLSEDEQLIGGLSAEPKLGPGD